MKHNQILEKLSHRWMVESLDYDLSRLLKLYATYPDEIMPMLFNRWNCVLQSPNTSEKSQNYKDKVWLAVITLMHKHGISIKTYLDQAFSSIDGLNARVVLSDAFHRQSDDIKTFLKSPPPILKRSPPHKPATTYYRKGDALSIQVGTHYFGAIIDEIAGINEAPIVRFYKETHKTQPTLKAVLGSTPQDGRIRLEGLTFLPDLAQQVVLLGACQTPPTVTPVIGTYYAVNPNAYSMSDLCETTARLLQTLTQD